MARDWIYQSKPPMLSLLQREHPNAQDLISAHLINEASGESLHDYAGNGWDGVFVNSPPWEDEELGPVLNFTNLDGTRVDVAGIGDRITGLSQLTMVIRCSIDVLDIASRTLWGVYSGTANHVYLQTSATGNGRLFGHVDNSAISDIRKSWQSADAGMVGGEMMTLAMVYDGVGSSMVLYFNGSLVPESASTGTIPATIGDLSGTDLTLGSRAAAQNFDGRLAYALLYERALTQEQVIRVTDYPFAMFAPEMPVWLRDVAAAAPPSASPDYYRRLTMNRQGRVA